MLLTPTGYPHMPDFRYLFTPIRVGTMTVPNRIAATTDTIMAGRAAGLPDSSPAKRKSVQATASMAARVAAVSPRLLQTSNG